MNTESIDITRKILYTRMVAGDGGGILTFTICSEGCPFWVAPGELA